MIRNFINTDLSNGINQASPTHVRLENNGDYVTFVGPVSLVLVSEFHPYINGNAHAEFSTRVATVIEIPAGKTRKIELKENDSSGDWQNNNVNIDAILL